MDRDASRNARLEGLIEMLLKELGEEPAREGLQRTPARVRRSLDFLTAGYGQDPVSVLNQAVFNEDCNEMVLVKDIEFYSLCEHHMLPFFGRAHVAYIPDGRIVGLSKIPRLLEMVARRLQVQERLTNEVATILSQVLVPKGVGVVVEAQHLCMQMRGVQKQGAYAITSAMVGEFESDPKTRAEFLQLVQHRGC